MTRFPRLYALLTGAPPFASDNHAGNENPADGAAGLNGPTGHFEEEDKVTATALFNKPRAVPPPTILRAMTEEQQLAEWLRRGQTEVFTVTTLVTPKMAEALLARNVNNRPVIWSAPNRSVTAYAEAMKRGEWVLNGETVIIASDGALNDGQHRLNAVVASGLSVQMQIAFGVERDTRHTVDQGVARSPGHILAMAGERQTNQLATALQFLWAMDAGASFNARPSTDQLLATLSDHPDIRECVKAVAHLVGEYRLSAGYIAAAHYLCQKHDAFSADQWLKALTTGLNIQSVNSPVSRLRKMYGEHSAKRQRKERIDQAALYIKGYNLFRRGRTGAFSWRANGPSPEAFPTVGG